MNAAPPRAAFIVHSDFGLQPAPEGCLRMFLFFSNRLGCGGSILLSVTITVLLLLVLSR